MDTSGLLVVAKNDAAHHFLAEQLKDHTCFRKYVCIVYGQVAHDKIKVDAPIGRHPTHRQEIWRSDCCERRVHSRGKGRNHRPDRR